jgi:hypothetical protein
MSSRPQSEQKIEWIDATPYSRGQENVQSVWEIKSGPVAIRITSRHLDYPGRWVMSCHPLAPGVIPMSGYEADMSVEEAKASAVRLVNARLKKIIAGLDEIDQVTKAETPLAPGI